ncbi:hypothetical protein Misp01_62110 [Microtetraspora sp. NBRC 13810]|uniref:hypothetical protein n=1 Tax=Microtetraspora sp. NBRC 13810 TaxID=3030990 RepID=UPI0024A5AA48|nr:hypothetical protein [Microtetraspora sp. NBRC 13810]GLW11083.1 hypothetical protein Misp01_62110 [Microtetraspora sp. NBRC 13810]
MPCAKVRSQAGAQRRPARPRPALGERHQRRQGGRPGGALRFILDGPRLGKVTGELSVLADRAMRRGFDAVRNGQRARLNREGQAMSQSSR